MSWRRERLFRSKKSLPMCEIVARRMLATAGCESQSVETRQQARKRLRDRAFASLPKAKYLRRARRTTARKLATVAFRDLHGDFSKVA